ncbi:MAG TPA: hypothetical protein VMU96_00960 [Casimicrobiaceae bacterium]|nr:hypothetical protein [Casimicrobiaceae bacterium]
MTACSPSPGPPPAATNPQTATGGWHEFQGSWNAAGTRYAIPLGRDRRAGILDVQGTMLLAGPSRPGVGFSAHAVALGDTATGVIGRAVWTDDKGDQVYSEFHGTGTATGSKIEGTFLGGTGRYAGANGTYEFTWQYVVETEDGTVQGRVVGMTGRVRVGESPQPAPPTSGAKQ